MCYARTCSAYTESFISGLADENGTEDLGITGRQEESRKVFLITQTYEEGPRYYFFYEFVTFLISISIQVVLYLRPVA